MERHEVVLDELTSDAPYDRDDTPEE